MIGAWSLTTARGRRALCSCLQSHHRSAAPQTFSLVFCVISRHWCGLGCWGSSCLVGLNSLAIRVVHSCWRSKLCFVCCAGVCAVEKRAAEVDLALATERQRGGYASMRWRIPPVVGDSTGSGLAGLCWCGVWRFCADHCTAFAVSCYLLVAFWSALPCVSASRVWL